MRLVNETSPATELRARTVEVATHLASTSRAVIEGAKTASSPHGR